MNHIEISHRNGRITRYSAPDSWDTITHHQLVTWSSICLQKIDLNEAKKQLVQFFYNIPQNTLQKLKAIQILQIADTLSFLFEKKQSPKWHLKKLFCRFRCYHGPADGFANLTIAEYRRTELYYQAYVRTQDKHWLILLAATLYRRKRKEKIIDDIREDLTEYDFLKRIKRFSKLGDIFLHAFLLNYESCRNHFIQQYAEAFTKTDSSTVLSEFFDLEKVIEHFAGEKFGNFNETEKTNLHRFFKYLVNSIKQLEAQKKTYDRNGIH